MSGHLYDYEYEDYDENMKYQRCMIQDSSRPESSGTPKDMSHVSDLAPSMWPLRHVRHRQATWELWNMAGRIVDVDRRSSSSTHFLFSPKAEDLAATLRRGVCCVLVLLHVSVCKSKVLSLRMTMVGWFFFVRIVETGNEALRSLFFVGIVRGIVLRVGRGG